MIKLISPKDKSVINLLTDIQKNFIENEEFRKNVDGGETYHWCNIKRETEECSIPLPVVFEWESDCDCTIEISQSIDFANCREYHGDKTANVYNLLYGITYYWRLRSAGGEISEVRSFKIEGTPRFIYVDGTTNVRDIGLSAITQRQIKQGLFYRGTEFNIHADITEKGLLALKNDIHLKTDLDVRGGEIKDIKESPVEKIGAQWINIPMSGYSGIFDDNLKENTYSMFEFLSDKSAYPLYTHCWGGADRTGCLCLMVEALLGVGISDLLLDYELTSLSVWGVRTRNYSEFIKFVDRIYSFGTENDDFSAKTRICLTEHFGISENTLDDIYNILKI